MQLRIENSKKLIYSKLGQKEYDYAYSFLVREMQKGTDEAIVTAFFSYL